MFMLKLKIRNHRAKFESEWSTQ